MRVGARRPVGVGARRLAGVGARRPVVVSAIRLAGVGAIGLALVGAVHAQTPTFEAIAIHPNHSGEVPGGMEVQPGRVVALNVTVRALIREVYRLRDFQIVGGPWATGNPATAACASALAPNGLPRCGTLTFRPGAISGRSVRIDQRPSEN